MFISPAARAQDCLWPTWTQVADNPELARYEHAMAYDAARGNVVMFGGRPAPGQVRQTPTLAEVGRLLLTRVA